MALSITEKKVFKLHLFFSTAEGITRGVIALNAFVLLKSLNGTEDQVGYLFTITWGIMVLTVLFNILMKNSKNIKRMLNIMSLITRAPMLLFAFFPLIDNQGKDLFPHLFLLIFLLYFISQPFFMPVINLALKTNYSKENFGRLFSYSNMVRNGSTLLATLVFGIMLDFNNNAYTIIYPVTGLLGFISIYTLTLIDFKTYDPEVKGTIYQKLIFHLKKMWQILSKNKPYRDFEIGFVFYGIAFMITDSVIKIFMGEYLKLNYTTLSVYENLRWIFAIGLTPIFARVVDKMDPRKLGIISFLSLAVYILFIGLTQYFDQTFRLFGLEMHITIVISLLFFGVFTATNGILWSIGSAYFCKDKDAADYQSIHMSLTGIRALIFPIIGIEILKNFNYSINFISGIIFLTISCLILYYSMKKYNI
ncbi:MAG: hypothetical protein A2W91_01190 [Bacteroidetes bacterium GWF2_38_335]|nr:MAG: hypothetical protein A2W91_01190 [Bacteroidetes bacterium GWF2_38_335]OFY80983.1 MAG: hypothetical protein A2281_13070 [Bacteroidetes bacterium RIFOXYA12_FULL_38_20]HBS85078.1 hypothetical protein [Bacteroidales bacterium]